MTSNDLLSRLARLGASRRLQELQDETNEILQEFPELGRATRTPETGAAEPAASTPAPRRTRRKMTAAQRKAVGERMKKYWAARRKQAAK